MHSQDRRRAEKVNQLAIHEAPYVVWRIWAYKEVVGGRDTEDVSYIYIIDAFSGEIREKNLVDN